MDSGLRRNDGSGWGELVGRAAGHVEPEVAPVGIGLLDQTNLPGAMPFLDLLLANDGGLRSLVRLVPDQALHTVFLGEALEPLVPMLPHATIGVAGDADIERAVFPAGEDVDDEGPGHG